MLMRRRLVVLGLSLVTALGVASCGGTATAPVAGSTQFFALVQPVEAAEVIATSDVVVLDVRTPEEFQAGHLEGAVNVDFYAADFETQLDALSKDVTYVVYCRSGNRSGQSIGLMEQLGFSSVYDVDGGILEWVDDGLPLAG